MVLIGYSGHAYVVYGIFRSKAIAVTGYCDAEEKNYNPFQLPYLGTEANKDVQQHLTNGFFISIGDNRIREKVFKNLEALNLHPVNAIHASAVVDESVQLAAQGIMIAANATLNPLVKIGRGAICNTSCSIDHECVVGEFAHIAPGAVLCGNVTIGDRSFIGANAVIRQGITIGADCTIGAGAVVIKDVPDGSMVVGVPAR